MAISWNYVRIGKRYQEIAAACVPFPNDTTQSSQRPPGVPFLSLNKKGTKEVSLGESAQASLRQFAPSPKNPSRNL